MPDTAPKDTIILTPEEKRRQRVRSLAIGWGLGILALLFFVMTVVRLTGNMALRNF